MWGAVIGDLAGSIYEFDQYKNISSVKMTKLFDNDSFFSDDTILTVAIIDAILNDLNYEYYIKKYANMYENYVPLHKPYFKHTFSPGFEKWVNSDIVGVSTGNGAMMRISPIGYMFDDKKRIIKEASNATKPSHNSNEAIEMATIIALIIYYARIGYDKEYIINKLNLDLKYKKFEKFNTTCSETIGNCLYALFYSNNFIDAIKKVISYGGDTDTNACIVGSMAEAMYGIDSELINYAKTKIPQTFVDKIELGYENVKILKKK